MQGARSVLPPFPFFFVSLVFYTLLIIPFTIFQTIVALIAFGDHKVYPDHLSLPDVTLLVVDVGSLVPGCWAYKHIGCR